MLCAISGRPTLLAIANRAVRVIWEQTTDLRPSGRGGIYARLPPFFQIMSRFRDDYSSFLKAKIENPKRVVNIPTNVLKAVPELGINSYSTAYIAIPNVKRQRLLVKLLTDRLTLSQLEKRGFQTSLQCRRGCGVLEDVPHFFGAHILPEIEAKIPRGLKRSLTAACSAGSLRIIEPRVAAVVASALMSSDNLTPAKKRRRQSRIENH